MKTTRFGISVLALALFPLAACSDSGPSEAELRDQQQMARAQEIGKAAFEQWKGLVDQVAAATAGAPAKEQASVKVEELKQGYLKAMAELNKELKAMNNFTAVGAVKSVLEKSQETPDWKQRVQLLEERAQGYGYDHRDFGEALRAYKNYNVVFAVAGS